jgi:3-oxoacyl-[acyl-carrier protein] reductase
MPETRVALVTGGSRGIGRAIARRLGADGVAVLVNYRQDGEAAAKVVADIEANGGRAVAARADVARPEELRGLFDTAEQRLGQLDILVCNAAVGPFAPLAAATDEDYENCFATNTRAIFVALREAARRLRDGGRIVVISAGVTVNPFPTAGVYTASKAAAEAMALVLAKELGPRGITVNCVLPGITRTDGAAAAVPKHLEQQIIAKTPLGRLGEPEDIADVVGFLVSDQGRWVTGQRIHAGGGEF